MIAEDIYRTTLEALAEEGNETAKAGLRLAERFATHQIPRKEIQQNLKDALSYLQYALEANAGEWTRTTDSEIFRAQSEITEAIASL